MDPLSNVFLTYANNDLRGHPEHLLTFLKAIEGYEKHLMAGLPDMRDHSNLDDTERILRRTIAHGNFLEYKSVLQAVIELADMGEHEADVARIFVEAGQWEKWQARRPEFRLAFDACYGYVTTPCNECLLTWGLCPIDATLLSGGSRLKCFECEQLLLKHTLLQIVRNESPNALREYIEARNELVTVKMVLSKDNKFAYEPLFSFRYMRDKGLNPFIRGIVGFALTEFLSKNNPKLLIICTNCGKFHIRQRGKDAPHTFCSDRCRAKFNQSTEETKENKRESWAKHGIKWEQDRAERELEQQGKVIRLETLRRQKS